MVWEIVGETEGEQSNSFSSVLILAHFALNRIPPHSSHKTNQISSLLVIMNIYTHIVGILEDFCRICNSYQCKSNHIYLKSVWIVFKLCLGYLQDVFVKILFFSELCFTLNAWSVMNSYSIFHLSLSLIKLFSNV